ncbi:hypothetical protein ACFFRR_004719 [Megaselia abdita]
MLFDVAFRRYFQLLQRTKSEDDCFLNSENLSLLSFAQCASVFTKFYFPESEEIRRSFKESILKNNPISLHRSIKTLNICFKQGTIAIVDWIYLDEIYFCLQTTREESLILFRNYFTSLSRLKQEEVALVILGWSWNNKNKYHLLAIIISMLDSEIFLENQTIRGNSGIESSLEKALRQCLSRKNLFSSSQSVIKSLDCKKPSLVQNLFEVILKTGSETELLNLKSQWFSLLTKKQELLDSLNFDFNYFQTNSRYLYKLDMFSEVILKNGDFKKLEFLKFLRENLKSFSDVNLLTVFKLLVNSLKFLDLQETLTIIISILELKRNIPSPEFRNNVSGKFSDVFNFIGNLDISKSQHFFESLQKLLFESIETKDYQPIIFSVKIILSLLKTFFADSVKGFSKKCHLSKNHVFGRKLREFNIINLEVWNSKMIPLLIDAGEYDDVRETIVAIIGHLKCQNSENLLENFKTLAGSKEINKVITSESFAAVLVNGDFDTKDFQNLCFQTLISNLEEFEKDPLKTATDGKHLFGYLNALNEVFKKSSDFEESGILEIIEKIVKMVLKMMSATVFKNEECSVAASFQVIEESLDFFVKSSSCVEIENLEAQRKFLLLSFWLSLKASCEIASTIGCHLSSTSSLSTSNNLQRCINLITKVLHLCRHKGAIEAAGLSLGKLVAKISSDHHEKSPTYLLLLQCFDIIFFKKVDEISTTRRGAGLSIMFHSLLKNDSKPSKPLFHHAIEILLENTRRNKSEIFENKDSLESLSLHYLCGIVKDSILKEEVESYYDEIILISIERIDSPEWTIRNGALQLFGGVLPKVVGQQFGVDDDEDEWQSNEVTYLELSLKYPKTCKYILDYCEKPKVSPSSVILFLQFLNRVEYFKKSDFESNFLVEKFRELQFKFLSHKIEKVRKLAATCLVSANDFQDELPTLLLTLVPKLSQSFNENFTQGVLFVLIDGLKKLKAEWKFNSNLFEFSKALKTLVLENLGLSILRTRESGLFLTVMKIRKTNF